MKERKVYVLLDRDALVYGVTTDEEIATHWLTLDPSFGWFECEVDDYTHVNAVCDELEEQ